MKRLRRLTARQWREAIHDEIGPQIFYLTAKARLLADALKGKKRVEAQAILRELDSLREKLRSLERGEIATETLDLTGGLRRLAMEIGGRFQNDWKQPLTDPRRATLLIQIAREAAHNAKRHGKASEMEIYLGRGELRVTDNGGGWPARIRDGTGMELMKRRARDLRGTIKLERGKTGGAILTCHFPVEPG